MKPRHASTLRNEPPADSTGQLLWLILAVLVAGTPHFFYMHPWVPLVVICCSAWRAAAAMNRWKLPGIWLKGPLTLLGFAGVLASYRQVSGLEAGSALLLVMVALKLLETRGERDRAVMVFICYFLLFAIFLREQAIWSAVYLAAGVIVTTAALYQTSRSGQVVAARTALALSLRIVAQAVPLMLILFVLFPRIPGPFWALPTGSGSGTSGLANKMAPGDITALALSDEIAFRVRFDAAVPPQEDLYWRGPVMTRFNGRTWMLPDLVANIEVPATTEIPQGGFEYEVTLEPHGQQWLLALDTPVEWDAPRAVLSSASQLMRQVRVDQRMAYRARSIPGQVAGSAASTFDLRMTTLLPKDRNPRTLELARQLRTESGNDRDYLHAILQRFSTEEYFYTLTPPALGRESVDEFLFETRQGFCGHYASAFAVLARAAGIPARIVTGYQGAERNPFADYWIVRQSDAHAWVEVWLDGHWTRFDPTAAVAPDRIELGFDDSIGRSATNEGFRLRNNQVFARLTLSWDAMNAGWNRWVLSFGPQAQANLLKAVGFEQPSRQHLLIAMTLTSGVFLVVIAFWQRRRMRARPDLLRRTYQRLCKRTGKLVRNRRPSEGPREYARALATSRPDIERELQQLFGMYLQLRYEGASGNRTLIKRFIRAVNAFNPGRLPADAPASAT